MPFRRGKKMGRTKKEIPTFVEISAGTAFTGPYLATGLLSFPNDEYDMDFSTPIIIKKALVIDGEEITADMVRELRELLKSQKEEKKRICTVKYLGDRALDLD